MDVDAFTLMVKDAPDKPGNRPGGEPVKAYAGEAKWTEPFTTGKLQTLRLEIHTWRAYKRNHYCVLMLHSGI